MKRYDWTKWLQRLRKPTAILSLAMLVGVGLNILFLLVGLSPQLVIQKLLSSQTRQLEQQKQVLDVKPLPVKVTDAEIRSLITKVPTRDESARIIVSLRDIEQKTGTTITSITFGEVANKDDGMVISLATPTPTPKATTGNGTAGAALIGNETITVEFSGRYEQVLDFMKRLQNEERLIRITTWKIDVGDQSQQIGSSSSSPPKEFVSVTLKLTVYSAKAFAGKFPNLPPISVDPSSIPDAYWDNMEKLKSGK